MFFTFPITQWEGLLKQTDVQAKLDELSAWLGKEYTDHLCTPEPDAIFRAFERCPEHQVKVVIIGQDPYPALGVADGLAFSTKRPSHIPVSLRNILIESGNPMAKNGRLDYWAEQGVLLLNTVLTTRVGEANAHRKMGWESFTESVVQYLAEKGQPMVFMFWGNQAKKQAKILQKISHIAILESGHPSPLSANRGHWFGNNHFNLANAFLVEHSQEPIDWNLSADTFNREPTLF
ncbi:MAG: uracil-DNA glycosylase [Flavobacteriaceae bacterium]